MSNKIFHAYDVRGIYQEQITFETAAQIGLLLADEYTPKRVVIGYDQRIGSDLLANALVDAFLDSGVDVTLIGLVPTPVVYFGVNELKADMGIMVTASHNPKEYVGFKITRQNAIPIGYEDGLNKIEARMEETILPTAKKKGKLVELSITKEFIHYVLPFASNVTSKRVLIDCSNGATGSIIKEVMQSLPTEANLVNITPDGTFPVHPPNPLDAKATDWLGESVKETQSVCGIMFDGDGDRIGVVDENGKLVPNDIIGLLIALDIAERAERTDLLMLYDLRSTKAYKELLEKRGIRTQKTKVGHTYIKKQLREESAFFASELSGHFYYQDFFNVDEAIMALFNVLTLLERHQRPLSEIADEVTLYVKSPEINLKVESREEAIATVKNAFPNAQIEEIDGVTIIEDTWWANIRSSNTEPLLRFNFEADTKEILDEKVAQVKSLLNQ